MPVIKCPRCKGSIITSTSQYIGTMQCDECAVILWVRLADSIVADVKVNSSGGPEVQGLPADVQEAYEETRRCMAAKCFAAVELLCRSILMHVAVEKGAGKGDSFVAYLSFLESKGFIAPQMRTWLDLIRRHGNETAHGLQKLDARRAESTMAFTAELLRLIYEMDFLARKFTKGS